MLGPDQGFHSNGRLSSDQNSVAALSWSCITLFRLYLKSSGPHFLWTAALTLTLYIMDKLEPHDLGVNTFIIYSYLLSKKVALDQRVGSQFVSGIPAEGNCVEGTE